MIIERLILNELTALNESKNYPLYHFTQADSFSSILRDGMIRGYYPGKNYAGDNRSRVSKEKVISVSRNKNFNFGAIRLELDTSAISSKYKIKPYQELATDRSSKDRSGAAEEVIIADYLEIPKYLVGVELVNSKRDGMYSDLVKMFDPKEFFGVAKTIKYAAEDNETIKLTSTTAEVALILVYMYFKGTYKMGPNISKLIEKCDLNKEDVMKVIKLYSVSKL